MLAIAPTMPKLGVPTASFLACLAWLPTCTCPCFPPRSQLLSLPLPLTSRPPPASGVSVTSVFLKIEPALFFLLLK